MPDEIYTGKWQVALVECKKCGKEWIAVSPVVTEYLECPLCGHMTPAPYIEAKEDA